MTRWEAQQAQAKREGFKNAWAMRIEKRKAARSIAEGLAPFHEELNKRHARRKPETAHPWRNPKPSEQSASCEDRFSQAPSHCVQLVKDGQPLTERGAELLMQQKMRVLDQVVCKAARKTWAQPPHSKQTKQVHNYQRTLGRK